MDERTRPRVSTGSRDLPEDFAEVDPAEVVGVDVRVRVGLVARAAVVRVARVVVAVQVRVVAEHRAVARARVRAEPGRVARRCGGVTLEVPVYHMEKTRGQRAARTRVVAWKRYLRVRVRRIALRSGGRSDDRTLLAGRAADVRLALRRRRSGADGHELAREGGDVRLRVSANLNGLAGLGVDVVEEVGSLDRVLGRARGGEVVRLRD